MSSWEAEELALHLCGIDPEDGDDVDIDDLLDEKFGVEFDQFYKIAMALLPMVTENNRTVSGTAYQGFADRSKNLFLLKQPTIT